MTDSCELNSTSKLRLHFFQHAPFEGLAEIETWVRERGHALAGTHWYSGDRPPDRADYDWLFVMGGPMSVHDTTNHAWLETEKSHIRQAIDAGKTVLGICFGAQLVAEALGATVKPNAEAEIGWFPISRVASTNASPLFEAFPDDLTVFHWHGQTYDIPAGARQTMRSEACTNQSFDFESRVVALQFHLEMNEQSIRSMIEHCGDELVPSTHVQPGEQMLEGCKFLGDCHAALFELLDRMAAQCRQLANQ